MVAVYSFESPLVRIDFLNGRLSVDNKEVRTTPLEARFVFFLALDAGGASREELCDEFFADSADARNALKVLVYRLREKLGRHSAIRYSDGRYALDHDPMQELREIERDVLGADDSVELDGDSRARFESYRDRLRESRPGALLDQPWFERVEWRLRQLQYAVSVRLGRDALARGDGGSALDIVAPLIELGALDEEATEIHMRAQLLLGNPAAALAHYDRYAAELQRELDTLPSESLRIFADTLRSA
jgi:DNA-binding SARP family transcriptional activator